MIPWWWLAVFIAAHTVVRVLWRRRVSRRSHLVARYETIMDFLPEDDHAEILHALEMEHVEGREQRARRCIELGGRRLVTYVKAGYRVRRAKP